MAVLLCASAGPAQNAADAPPVRTVRPARAAAAPAGNPPSVVQPGGPAGPDAQPPGQPPVQLTPATRPDGQPAEPENLSPDSEIQLSFQGANIEMIVQWLAKVTGKSVLKHPRAQCQLTIVSSKKLKARDAINLVYKALSLEGITTIESSKSIFIVPEGSEPKLNPEMVDAKQTELPDGRQKLIKIFPLQNIQATEARDKIKGVLSEKATVEVSDRANQIIVTDYTDNIRIAGELLKALDIASGGDTAIEFFPLKYSEAEELSILLSAVLNAQSMPASTPGKPVYSSRSSSSSQRSFNPFMDGPDFSSSSSSSSQPSGPSSTSTTAAAANQVKIWPDKVSNRLIVGAQKSKMPEIKKLIDLLDTEKPQDVALRVLPLKNVNAEDLVKDLGPLYQKMSGKSVKEMIEISANTRANSLIVLSSETNFKAIEKLVSTLDTEEAQEKAMRSFPLKNADAEDVAKQLQDLNQDQSSNNRYPYYIYSSYGMNNQTGKKATYVADRRRNTVIVQAPASAMESIEKLINALDEPVTDDSLTPRIIRLKYVSSTDIEDVLNELFLKKQQQRTYFDPYGFPNQDRDTQNSGRLYGKVRITSEPYANALIITSNSKESLVAVEEVIKELDKPSQAGETTLRVALRFAKASVLANNINILFAKNGSPPLRGVPQQNVQQPVQQNPQQATQPSQNTFALEQEAKEDGYFPWLGGQQDNFRGESGRNVNRPVSDLVGRVRVVPDQRSNALLISANVHFFPEVLKLIDQLDAPTAQVLIDAKILEVSSDFLDKLGVRWSPNGGATFTADDLDNSILAKAKGEYATQFGGQSTVLANSLHSLRSGVLDSTINLDFLVQFLRRTTDATVLAEPQINIADNELGKLFVGQQVPFIDKSLTTEINAISQSFTYKDVGVILEVTPHINNSGDVALKIRAESSSIVPGQTLFGGAILDTRNFKTDLTARNGETLVLGGIIQRQKSDTLRKTPFLGSIPGLGWAFKKRDTLTREVELIVFLRPKVVRSPEEARELSDEMDKKAPLIKKWREESLERKEEKKLEKQSEEKKN
jgi:type II secretion system protein D